MAESTHRLSFERPIYELEARIQKLEDRFRRRSPRPAMKFAACGAS